MNPVRTSPSPPPPLSLLPPFRKPASSKVIGGTGTTPRPPSRSLVLSHRLVAQDEPRLGTHVKVELTLSRFTFQGGTAHVSTTRAHLKSPWQRQIRIRQPAFIAISPQEDAAFFHQQSCSLVSNLLLDSQNATNDGAGPKSDPLAISWNDTKKTKKGKQQTIDTTTPLSKSSHDPTDASLPQTR